MKKITVADLGVEGGGLTIYGRPRKGSWLFLTKGNSITADENDDEDWKFWTTEPVADLLSLLPAEWPLFYPMEIHPEFRSWFRDHYDKACAMLPDHLKENQARYRDNEWRQILDDPGTRGPDVKA